MKCVALCTNPLRDKEFAVTKALRQMLSEQGVEVRHALLPEKAVESEILFQLLEEAIRGAELLICLGGDGTILHAAKAAAEQDVPILGINMGNRGFLADLEATEYALTAEAVAGKGFLDSRMMINVTVERGGAEIFRGFALNEAVVAKDRVAHTIELQICGDGRNMYGFLGDGVIVATPTGSTAYSMSAGGPIVEPSSDNLIITPICAHDLRAKSFLVRGDAVVTVELKRMGGRCAFLSLDGDESAELLPGDLVRIERSDFVTRLLRVKNRSFYEIVHSKLDTSRKQ